MDGALSLNQQSGYYEGTITIQVNAEIFKRVLIKEIEDDESADLTDPQTWSAILARIGTISYWIDRPHTTKVTRRLVTSQLTNEPQARSGGGGGEGPKPKEKSRRLVIEERLRALVSSLPPHRWEECLTPIADFSIPEKERDAIHQIRYFERKALKKLLEEWKQGTFVLENSAEEEEKRYQNKKDEQLLTTVEAVSSAVNGNRLH